MDASDARAINEARSALTHWASKLRAAHARDEALAELVNPRRVFGIRRAPRFTSLGRAWRLGALLVGHDGRPWRTGLSVRVTEPGRPQYLSSSVEERRELRAAALRGGFQLGDTLNHSIELIALDDSLAASDGPLTLQSGDVMVRWGDDSPLPLAHYLDDLGSLLLHPRSS